MGIKMKKIFYVLLIILISISCRDNITDTEEVDDVNGEYVLSMKSITTPSERVRWIPGNTYEITWEITENIEHVKMEIVRKYSRIATIVDSTPNDGKFEWVVPTNLPYSHHYRIKLTPHDKGYPLTHSVEFEILDKYDGG